MDFLKELKTICASHDIDDEAYEDIKTFFDNAIIKVFHSHYSNPDKADKKISAAASAASSEHGICNGKKADGNDCQFKAKASGFCGRHDPDKESKTTSKSSTAKKTTGNKSCGATIASTGKGCAMTAAIKPEGAKNFYCKRHENSWTKYEEDEETLHASSDNEQPIIKKSTKQKRKLINSDSENEEDTKTKPTKKIDEDEVIKDKDEYEVIDDEEKGLEGLDNLLDEIE